MKLSIEAPEEELLVDEPFWKSSTPRGRRFGQPHPRAAGDARPARPPPAALSLSRTEVAHLADVLDTIVAQHGGAQRRTADELRLPHDLVGKILGRPANVRLMRTTLHALAEAVSAALGKAFTAEQLLRGQARPRPGVTAR